ncbi:diacylglycerol kinase family protein [Nocardioides daphniae]|nr:diacylglycerol kinase family protein [Nocardioides daphniae]
MLDRTRPKLLTAAGVCALLFAALAFAVTWERTPLAGLDDLGQEAAGWTARHDLLTQVLLVVEDLFNTVGMTVLTVLLAGALLWKKHPRAAIITVVVMVVTSLLTTGLKLLLSRERPDWQEALGLHDTLSFPSGHASSITAYTGLLAVLAVIFLRKQAMRRAAMTGLSLIWLVVVLDRVLLGRHYPTDVIAGTLLALSVLLVALVWFDPRPKSIAEKIEPLQEVYSSRKRLAVVLNPIKVEDVGAFRDLVTNLARDAGWQEPTWHYTTVEDPGTGMAAAAAADGVDLVLVCGGDGTVREVCAQLAGSGIPVGIIPAGTGNLLARNLDVPLYIRSAIDVGLNGQDRAIDMVEVTGDGIEKSHFM